MVGSLRLGNTALPWEVETGATGTQALRGAAVWSLTSVTSIIRCSGDHWGLSPDQEGDHKAATHTGTDHYWLIVGTQGGDGRGQVTRLVPGLVTVTDLSLAIAREVYSYHLVPQGSHSAESVHCVHPGLEIK